MTYILTNRCECDPLQLAYVGCECDANNYKIAPMVEVSVWPDGYASDRACIDQAHATASDWEIEEGIHSIYGGLAKLVKVHRPLLPLPVSNYTGSPIRGLHYGDNS